MKNKYEKSDDMVVAIAASLVGFAVIGFLSLFTWVVMLIGKLV